MAKKHTRIDLEFEGGRQYLTSPPGKAGYVNLDRPSKDYKNYQGTLILSPEEVAPLKDELDALADEVEAQLKAQAPKKAKLYEKRNGIQEETDDEGDPTGNFLLKTRAPGEIKYTDEDTGEKKVKKARPPIAFDAKGKRIKDVPKVWGGSTIALSFEARPYVHDASKSYGVSLRLSAYQIIKLVSGGIEGMSADQFGFGSHDGYSEDDEDDDEQDPPFDTDEDNDLDMDRGNF